MAELVVSGVTPVLIAESEHGMALSPTKFILRNPKFEDDTVDFEDLVANEVTVFLGTKESELTPETGIPLYPGESADEEMVGGARWYVCTNVGATVNLRVQKTGVN